MAKNSITDYSKTAASNTDIQSVDIAEGCLPSGINNAIREIMADLADVNDGTVSLTSPAFTSVDINGGTIDGAVIGSTTSAGASFTDVNIAPASGFARLEMGGASGAYIDMKAPFSDDYDGRILHDGSNLALTTSSGGGNIVFQVADQTKMSVISTGIDVNGTVTADGLTVSNDVLIDDGVGRITLDSVSGVNRLLSTTTGFGAYEDFEFRADNYILKTSTTERMRIASNGDISFYNSAGTSQSLFWDASAEALGLGTTSPEGTLHVENVSNNSLIMDAPANRFNSIGFQTAGVDKWWLGRADSDQISGDAFFIGIDNGNATDAGGLSNKLVITQAGSVGIGTSSNLNDQLTVGTAFDGFTASVSGAVTTIRLGGHDTSVAAGRFDYDRATGLLTYKEGTYDSEGSALLAVTNSGAVGIGTSSPTLDLSVDGGIWQGNGGGVELGRIFNDAGVWHMRASANVTGLAFGTNNTERLRIKGDGSIGINSTTTSSLLTVGNGYDYTLGSTSGDVKNALDLVYDTTNSDHLRFYAKRESNGSTWEQAKHVIERQVDTTKMGQIKFGSHTVDPISFGNNNSEFARFDGSGNVLVGTTTDTGGRVNITNSGTILRLNTTNTSNLAVHFVYNSTSEVGTITTTTTSTAYNTSSDYRLKENVTGITDGIERVKQLNPSRFNFIADADKTVDGFIAHEAQTVVPEAVTGEKDAVDADGNPKYQGIDQAKLVPLLTAALQEAITKIEDLEARVATLEGN